ncbi:hypothetical protein LCGC14_1121590 [marine sediment metagenome]|uniref:CobQ/CobB/MinD/ParA nucleotide binding domain-containing protein n=1 Tax=marine sediment metagenome TaxID=412755 RepID=A0A0F9MRK6_9ZZZZ
MKIAVTGKGGVGKTTITSTLSHLYAASGRKVLAVDADPDANLAAAFGLPDSEIEKIHPIADLPDLIAERTGAKPGSSGGVFRLNPRVDDIPEEVGYKLGNITLIVTGKSRKAATGCYCPENVLLRRLLRHLIVERDEVVILDMEAGIEHLTRGTTEAMDAFIVVVEPGQRSIQTAHTVKRLAGELGIQDVMVVANKVRGEADIEKIRQTISDGMRLLGSLSYNEGIIQSDMDALPPFENNPLLISEITLIKENLEQHIKA